ncbi:hypothetical protein NPIL_296811 [Nephila pilipes]|uniref:Uncharacterized protein n=1 Tax=Nephila pilipes TaxID=299642 RepID=A0A8X6UBK6_NEPPI|nr:hypothetical protein NPIL_296811 [Nephila pilipes]
MQAVYNIPPNQESICIKTKPRILKEGSTRVMTRPQLTTQPDAPHNLNQKCPQEISTSLFSTLRSVREEISPDHPGRAQKRQMGVGVAGGI